MTAKRPVDFDNGQHNLVVQDRGGIEFGDNSTVNATPPRITTIGPYAVFENLPTSDPGFAGALWNNAGVLSVSAG